MSDARLAMARPGGGQRRRGGAGCGRRGHGDGGRRTDRQGCLDEARAASSPPSARTRKRSSPSCSNSDKVVVDGLEHVLHRETPVIALMIEQGTDREGGDPGAGRHRVRRCTRDGRRPDERIFFSPIGMGIEDVCLCHKVYKLAAGQRDRNHAGTARPESDSSSRGTARAICRRRTWQAPRKSMPGCRKASRSTTGRGGRCGPGSRGCGTGPAGGGRKGICRPDPRAGRGLRPDGDLPAPARDRRRRHEGGRGRAGGGDEVRRGHAGEEGHGRDRAPSRGTSTTSARPSSAPCCRPTATRSTTWASTCRRPGSSRRPRARRRTSSPCRRCCPPPCSTSGT